MIDEEYLMKLLDWELEALMGEAEREWNDELMEMIHDEEYRRYEDVDEREEE